MRAVRIHEYGGPEQLVLDEGVAEPELDAESVLIETAAVSVNPIDWKIRSGKRQKDFPMALPAILGKDVSGIVRRVGASVRHFTVGDRVLANAAATYAEWVAVKSSIVTHLPEGLDLVDAAALPLAILTGDQLVRNAARATSGQTIVVSGALGSVGRAAVHCALKMNLRVIAGVRTAQLGEARALPVSGVLALDDDAAIAALAPVDAVADTVGNETAAKLIARVKSGGHLGYASVLPEGLEAEYPNIKISRVFAQPDPSKVREFADEVRDGRFVLPIGRRFALRDAAEAHRLGERGGIGKIILVVRGG